MNQEKINTLRDLDELLGSKLTHKDYLKAMGLIEYLIEVIKNENKDRR